MKISGTIMRSVMGLKSVQFIRFDLVVPALPVRVVYTRTGSIDEACEVHFRLRLPWRSQRPVSASARLLYGYTGACPYYSG